MNRRKPDGRQADVPPTPPEALPPDPSNAPITPGEEPSAIERGARIFERLRRRPPGNDAG